LPGALKEAQCFGGIELRHGKIGNHQIPILPAERGGHVGRGFDPLRDRIVPGMLHPPEQQQEVVFRVFYDQYSKRFFHQFPYPPGKASLRISQYNPSWRTASMNGSKSTGFRISLFAPSLRLSIRAFSSLEEVRTTTGRNRLRDRTGSAAAPPGHPP